MDLAPNVGIGDVLERLPVNPGHEVPACAGEDDDLVRPILRNPVERIDHLRVRLRRERKRAAIAMELHNQDTVLIPRQFQVAVGGEIAIRNRLHDGLPYWNVLNESRYAKAGMLWKGLSLKPHAVIRELAGSLLKLACQ